MAITQETNYPAYTYSMGFMIGSTAIPDPAVFTGAESDLDTMGERDATGYLHRDMVATKHPLKLEYKGIPWSLMMQIGQLLRADKFQFTYPDPFYSSANTIDAYVGDREWEAEWSPSARYWVGNLKFSVIEY